MNTLSPISILDLRRVTGGVDNWGPAMPGTVGPPSGPGTDDPNYQRLNERQRKASEAVNPSFDGIDHRFDTFGPHGLVHHPAPSRPTRK